MENILNRILKLIPAVLGIVGVLIPAAREVAMSVIRLLSIPFSKLEDAIVPVGKFFDTIQGIYNKLKDFFL